MKPPKSCPGGKKERKEKKSDGDLVERKLLLLSHGGTSATLLINAVGRDSALIEALISRTSASAHMYTDTDTHMYT